jgi:hypothetical protein
VSPDLSQNPTTGVSPFARGAMVIVTLSTPRDKFWGAILALTAEGLGVCGIELASFDNLVAMIKEGDPLSPTVAFFPMHRLERIELDLPDGNVSSLSQRFASRTGMDASSALLKYSSTPGESQ